ncbi:MAG: histidine kinase dimerization/phosphoacceptor domain -containing protein, partial [Bacteroidota bacterium]
MLSKRLLNFLAFIGILCLSFQSSSLVEEKGLTRTWYDRIEEVKNIMEGFFNDEALEILRELESEIAEEGMQLSRIGILTQLYIGDALEKDQKDQEAIKKLLWVRELSLDKGYTDIYAETCIILALLYEKLDMQTDCRANLHQAEQAILTNQLDTIFPEFAIRKSSYYRVFGFPDSAIIYAKQALETALVLEQQEQISVAHLLLGMLKRDTPEEALVHFQECIQIYTDLRDYTGCIYAYVNSLRCYQRLERYEEALLYSDSAVMAIPIAIANGNDAFTWGSVYSARAEVFYKLGQIDSAWYNINKASRLNLEFERRNNAQQVAEIDAKYNDEKKAQRLVEQEQVIKFERQRRIFLTVLTLLFLGFSAILTFYYLRLRTANRKTVQQAKTITKKNEDLSRSLEEQIILQSEVHHRVKNNLQVIISLLEIQKEDLTDSNAIQNLDAMANRIYSM